MGIGNCARDGRHTEVGFSGYGLDGSSLVAKAFSKDSFWAIVQLSEGEPDPAVVVPVQVSGQRVAFATAD